LLSIETAIALSGALFAVATVVAFHRQVWTARPETIGAVPSAVRAEPTVLPHSDPHGADHRACGPVSHRLADATGRYVRREPRDRESVLIYRTWVLSVFTMNDRLWGSSNGESSACITRHRRIALPTAPRGLPGA